VRLQSINTGEYHRITQNLGAGSISCNIDVEAMDQVALSLIAELNEGVDLLFINRFGKRESQGGGFCCVIERAIELNIPVLTVVRESWQGSWLDYGGEWVTLLPAEHEPIVSWCEQVCHRGVAKTA
jgi:nucleoside-triphosphatase THEP1